MRAMVLNMQAPVESAPLRMRELPAPEPGPREVRVRIEACGICRTDLHVVEGDLPPVRESQIIPGHQVAAVLFAPASELVLPALEALEMGGTVAVAGIHLSDIPRLTYRRHLFREKTLRSVTANTRRDGEELLALASTIPLRPETTRFSLEDANFALQQLKRDAIQGSGVLML